MKTIESHIVVKQGGILQIIEDHVMHDEATITVESGGYLAVCGYIQNVVLTVETGGTLDIGYCGCILLKGRKHLHLESGAIILCNGELMSNDGLHIYTKPDDVTSSEIEKLDSLEIQSLINY